MIPVIFNPYPDASTDAAEALDHAAQAAKNLRHLEKQLSGCRNELSYLQARASEEICDSLHGCVLLREEGRAHETLATLLLRLKGKKELYEAVRWLLAFFSKGRSIEIADLEKHDETRLQESDLPVPLLGYAAAQGGITTTVAADANWRQEFFYLRNPSAKVLNVSSRSRQETLEYWAREWLKNNLEFANYLESRFDVRFFNGALNTLPKKQFHAALMNAFEKARAQEYASDGDRIKPLNTGGSKLALLELRTHSDGARVFFLLRDGRPHIAGFYTKGQAVNQNKAIQQAIRRASAG